MAVGLFLFVLLKPLTSKALGFGNVSRVDYFRNDIAAPLGSLIAATRADIEPHMSHYIVLRNPRTMVIHGSEVEMRFCEPLIRRQLKPLHRLGIVLRDTQSIPIGNCKIVLGFCFPLFGD